MERLKVEILEYSDFDVAIMEITFIEPLIMKNGDSIVIEQEYLENDLKTTKVYFKEREIK